MSERLEYWMRTYKMLATGDPSECFAGMNEQTKWHIPHFGVELVGRETIESWYWERRNTGSKIRYRGTHIDEHGSMILARGVNYDVESGESCFDNVEVLCYEGDALRHVWVHLTPVGPPS